MSAAVPSRSNDPHLAAFLDASSDAEAWQALDALLTGDLDALMRETVARRLSRSRRMADHLEDVVREARLKLTGKLWSLRAARAAEPIENISAYAVTTSERTCYAFLRREFPERTRLRNRLRYALTHHPKTALEEDGQGVWRCRFTGVRRVGPPGSTQSLLEGPRTHATTHNIDLSASLPTMVEHLLATCDQPVEFDRFVDAMALLLGVSDTPPASGTAHQHATGQLDPADRAPIISAVLEQRSTLEDVWNELMTLPVRQRAALLLNLRDGDGGATLQLLPATGIVSQAGIAETLEIPEDELARLWDDLPLDDQSIALRLGVTRQQVINLRKSGRARLARRLSRGQG